MTDDVQDGGRVRHVQLLAVTGGPGAGKTAVLELIRRNFCQHVTVLPEAASIIYGGGFPRNAGDPIVRRAGQRAIYAVQKELERIALEQRRFSTAICDRGTVDGIAYWPDDPASYWTELGTTLQAEYARYAAVIHLRTPKKGYNHENPLRIESAAEAARIDQIIFEAWSGHPRRIVIDASEHFLDKALHALQAIRAELPAQCQEHIRNEARDRR